MSEGKRFLNISELSGDVDIVYKKLRESSDTVCVVLGTSFIEQCLSNILYHNFPNKKIINQLLNIHNGLLNTISAKYKVAFALNLINKDVYDDIKKIAEIRNKFAHNHLEITFQNHKVQDICNSLKHWGKRFTGDLIKNHRKKPANNNPDVIRTKFIDTVVEICNNFLVVGLIHKIIYKE